MKTAMACMVLALTAVTGFSVGQAFAAGTGRAQTIIRNGGQPAIRGPARFFTGSVRIDPLYPAGNGMRSSGGSVTFEPGARSNWHIHPVGQVLIITSGVGRTHEWGKTIRELRPGDVVICPAGVKHWHGAKADSWFSHIAVGVPGEDISNEWLEPVTDEEYAKLK